LALDDTSHAIALGAAIGVLIGLTPTVGLQTVAVMLTAFLTHRLFYFNRAAALLTIYISNPLTLAPLYYGLYCVGTWFVPGDASVEQFDNLLTYEGLDGWWETLRGLIFQVGQPLAIGTLIVAPIGGVATYPMVRFLLRWFRSSTATDEVQEEACLESSEEDVVSSDTEASPHKGQARSATARNDARHPLPSQRDVVDRKAVLSR
jgi:uncharacterized protein (DUF2062 family)